MTMPSTTSSEGLITPTHTTTNTNTTNTSTPSDSDLPTYSSLSNNTLSVCPWPGGTFIIRDPCSKLIITLRDGLLGLHPPEKEHGGGIYHYGRGSHWRCVQDKDMWLGFCNSVSGTYMGHDNDRKQWRFVATARKHAAWECFTVRQHPEGGHVLMVKHKKGFLPMSLGGMGNGELVIDSKRAGGTPWEFVRVDT